jgi:hypothetical protein
MKKRKQDPILSSLLHHERYQTYLIEHYLTFESFIQSDCVVELYSLLASHRQCIM